MLRIGRLVIGLVVAVFFFTPGGEATAQIQGALGGGGCAAAAFGGGGVAAVGGGGCGEGSVPPSVLITGPAVTVNTRTPIIRVQYTPSGPGPLDRVGTVTATWGGTSITSLGRHNDRIFEWEVNEALRLSPGVGKTFSITVCNKDTPAKCTTRSRTTTLQAGNHSVLSVTVNPFESLGRLSGASLGPFGIQGTEVITASSTPAYVSMNSPRTAGLTYSSRQSYPRAVVNATIEFPVGTKPSTLNVRLLDGGVIKDEFTQSNPNCGTSATTLCWVSLQLPYATTSYPTPTRKWLKIESKATYGSTVYTSVDSMEVVMVDRRTTPYGSGWWPTGVMQLVTAGNDAIIVGSDGTATVFRGNDGQYLSPPGNYNVLSKSGSNWLLTFPEGGGSVTFDSQGRQTNIKDSRNNTTTISYTGTPTRVYQITDPVGKKFTFAYSSDRINKITGPGGRQTLFSVNSGNRTMTSVSPPNPSGQTLTTTYGWNNTHSTYKSALPAYVQNSIGSSSRLTLAYSSALFANKLTFPTINNENGTPTSGVNIRYNARELQGDGAAISLASVYAESFDALNNWARSTLDRFGSPTKVWDAVGTVSQATYNEIGQVLTSEGKQGDSTRVFTNYDSEGRRLRSYRVRNGGSVMTLDSVAYTGTSRRPTKVFDYLGNWTEFTYQNGQVTRAVTSFNDTTWTYYRSDGLVDSTKTNHVDGPTSYTYNTTWKNTATVTGPGGNVLSSNGLDSYGRTVSTVSKISVSESSGGTTQMQWRRRLTALNVVGGVDRVRVERTANCAAPCNTASWPDSNHTSQTATTRNTFDSLGRVVKTVYPGEADSTETEFDVLGRVTKRYPHGSAGPSETFKYDVASRLRFHTTLGGHSFETRYDTRGRTTKRILGTDYTYDYVYGGPNDELTAIDVASGFRDEVGSSHLDMAWVYNKSGGLVSDTAWSLSTMAWNNAYSYDSDYRPTQVTSRRGSVFLGTDQFKYHAVRGTMDTLVSARTGRVAYARDSNNRLKGPWIDGSGVDFSRTQRWRSDGSLWEIDNDQGYQVGLWGNDIDPVIDSLVPEWTEKRGSGATAIVMGDSMAYDGWQRVIRLDQRSGSSHAIQTFNYDNIGNLSINGTWTFNGRNQVTSTNSPVNCSVFTYDNAGNMTGRTCVSGTWVYSYDVLNQLVEVKKNGVVIAEYTYNPMGQRVAERLNGSTITRFVWRGGHVFYEVNNGSSVLREYTWGVGANDLVAVHNWQVSGQNYYVVQDRLRSVRGLVRKDGTWAMSMRYKAYGEQSDSTGSVSFPLRFRWQGAMYDEATGLYYMNARYYDPQLGRFLTEDPIGRAGGSNLYAFVGGDPMSRRDPSGTTVSLDAQYDAVAGAAPMEEFDPSIFHNPLDGGGGGGGLDLLDDSGEGSDVVVVDCKENDIECLAFVEELRALAATLGPGDDLLTKAADLLDGTTREVVLVSSTDRRLDRRDGLNSDGDPNTYTYGATTIGNIFINGDVSRANQLMTVAHEALFHNLNRGLPSNPSHRNGRGLDVSVGRALVSRGVVPLGFIWGLSNAGVPGATSLWNSINR